MSAWGVGVWEDDVASDVVIMFDDLREEGLSPQEALARVLADPPWGWGDRGDDVVQILALAALALQHSVLDATLRERAITTIESSAALRPWTATDPADVAARTLLLERFQALLQRGSATADELKSVTIPRVSGSA